MSTEEVIEFKFPTVRSKLQNLFPFDPKYDIEIIFKNNKYELQTAYLRLESGFFKNFNPHVAKVIKIEEQFDEVYFEQTMKCFYGGVFKCNRNSLFQVWKIFDYLKIQSFKRQTLKDMKANFAKYNFFDIMAFAFFYNLQQLFTSCLNILDSADFAQLKNNKDQVVNCPLQLFRFLLNTHNRRPKNRRALNFIEVNSLLVEYCEKNQFSDDFYKELKFQLIEKTQLTAEQYRLIFIEGAKIQSTGQIPQPSFSKKSFSINNSNGLIQSARIITNRPIMKDQKLHWYDKLQLLKDSSTRSQTDSKSMQNFLQNLSKNLKKKVEQSKMRQKTLAKMEQSVRGIQKQIEEKRDCLKKITERIQKLESSYGKGRNSKQAQAEQQEQKDVFVQSHIIPGFCLGDIMGQTQAQKKELNLKPITHTQEPTASTANFSKKKKSYYESFHDNQNSTQYKFKNSLIFDKEPISVPRKYLDDLAKLMDTNQFVKKRQLNLVFRRSKSDKNSIGDPSAIKNRSALLVLFETSHKKYAGGYLSVQIPTFTKADSLCDYQAFIFSLTHNVKMPIMKGEEKSAISLSKHYLLSFANDLMISNDCLNQVSYCEWPGIYQVPKNSKCQQAKDLVGSSDQFRIQQIDIYQVKNQQMEMIL